MVRTFPFSLLPIVFFAEGFGAILILSHGVFSSATASLEARGIAVVWFAIAVGLVTGVTQCIMLKRKLMAPHQSDTAMVPTAPDNHPGLAVAELETQTAQLKALGFDTIIDYTLKHTPPSPIDGFARLLYHNGAHVYAEINQVMLQGRPATPMATSLFGLFGDGWSFSTFTRPPTRNTAILYALRRPKRLWQIVPNAPLQAAFAYQARAVQILTVRRQLTPVAGDPVEAYLANQELQKVERFDIHRRRNLFAFLWDVDRYNASPKLEWMGAASSAG